MSIAEITNALNSIGGNAEVNFTPYNIKNVHIFYGLPPVPIVGLDYVEARNERPKTTLVKCLTGNAVHVDNVNQTGTIQLGLMSGSPSGGAIQLLDYTGVPFPIFIQDGNSLASVVIGIDCRLAETPAWRKAASPGLDIYTFSCKSVTMIHGMRVVE